MEIGEMVTTILASIGGSAVVVGGLTGWVGKLWSDRIIESQKAQSQVELETLKSSLEIGRQQQMRISDARFELYTDIWNVLQDLQLVGEWLWERADRERIEQYVAVLSTAKHRTRRGRLILREDHYQTLMKCLAVFSEYRAGKMRLVEIRSDDQLAQSLSEHHPDQLHAEIRNQIEANGDTKAEYESILEDIAKDFRRQLGIGAEQKVGQVSPEAAPSASPAEPST